MTEFDEVSSPAPAKSKKGGMSPNAFGGQKRLDQLDLLQFRGPDTTSEQLLLLSTITDAVHNYRDFALGRNGTSPDEFIWAFNYLFQVRSTDKSTWAESRTVYQQSTDENGNNIMVPMELTDDQLMQGCFDVHYTNSGLDRFFHLDRFLRMLKKRREEILAQNWTQVKEYLQFLREKDYIRLNPGSQMALNIETTSDEAIRSALVSPKSFREVANLVYHATSRARIRKSYYTQKPRIIRVPKPRIMLETPAAEAEFEHIDAFFGQYGNYALDLEADRYALECLAEDIGDLKKQIADGLPFDVRKATWIGEALAEIQGHLPVYAQVFATSA